MRTSILAKEALLNVMSPNEKLRYHPISRPNEIRLVKILPGLRISPIKCELQSALLDPEPPKYVALSYCWGDTNDKTWLNCNGQRLTLTKNLLNAIRTLRQKDKTVILWIDQICINQENLEERSSQVLLMQQIYKSATNVLIWLGDKADGSNMAMDLIPRLSGTSDPELECKTLKKIQAVKALLSRPWFGRMWILQELGAASSATMMCGKKTIPWQDVSNLVDHMNHTFRGLVFGSSESSLLALRRLENLKSFREGFPGREVCFFSALCMSRSFDATDPHDKIFALFGCCNYKDYLVQPDYSIDFRRLYQEIARVSLFVDDSKGSTHTCFQDSEKRSGMRFLCEAERTENTYDLPSWVPDWRARSYPSLWKSSSEIAAGTTKTKIALLNNSKISLAGKIGDAVHLISSIAPPGNYSPSPVLVSGIWRDKVFQRVPQSCWITEASSLAATCPRYRDNASRDAAFGTILIGNGCVYDTSSPLHTDLTLYYRHFRQFLSKLCPNGVVNRASIQQLSFILNEYYEGYYGFEGYSIFDSLYQKVAQGRRFFTTLSGYMGIGPPHMRSGDLVCVFLGGRRPWVIRQDGPEYSLVGECYVHGIMNGEFMETENLPVKDIIVK